MMQQVLDLRWSIIGAAVAGVLLAPLGSSWWRAMQDAYDDAWPVVTLEPSVLKRDADSMLVHLVGKKHRGCTYLRIQAYTRRPDGTLADAFTKREDMPERGATKPVGQIDVGQWRIWPLTGGVAVEIYSQHDCDGRLVTTRVAEVKL